MIFTSLPIIRIRSSKSNYKVFEHSRQQSATGIETEQEKMEAAKQFENLTFILNI